MRGGNCFILMERLKPLQPFDENKTERGMKMNFTEVKEQALRYLDEVGTSDYDERIDGFIDEAQLIIATQWGFIRKKATLTTENGLAELPDDCFAVEKVIGSSYEEEPLDGDGKRMVSLSGSEDGQYTLVYKAYPPKGRILIPQECHPALCILAAANTQLAEDNKQTYQLLLERYNNEAAMVERARSLTGKARVIVRG